MTPTPTPTSPGPRTPFEERYLGLAREICLETIPDERFEIFLFGSRARGHADHSSDVDIGILGPEPAGELVGRLWSRLDASDVPWRCQVADFRRHAFEGRELWRAAS
jgi:predicted nucleotidyltransferase